MLTMELLKTDLEKFKLNQPDKRLTEDQARDISIQLVESLSFLKQQGIIHGDLKPDNVMMNDDRRIALIDFGFAQTEKDQPLTPYHPFEYRAPELMLCKGKYTHAIDMWAFGVMLYEFITGQVLFSAKSSTELIQSLISVLGQPPKQSMHGSPLAQKIFGQKKKCPDVKMRPMVSINDEKLKDLILSCLKWDPEDRITPEEALKHPWMKMFGRSCSSK